MGVLDHVTVSAYTTVGSGQTKITIHTKSGFRNAVLEEIQYGWPNCEYAGVMKFVARGQNKATNKNGDWGDNEVITLSLDEETSTVTIELWAEIQCSGPGPGPTILDKGDNQVQPENPNLIDTAEATEQSSSQDQSEEQSGQQTETSGQ